jgi:hypothetical protein
LEITFRVRADAPPGPAIINLRQQLAPSRTLLNEGGLLLTPAPRDVAGDVLDGVIKVQVDPLVTREHVRINGRVAEASRDPASAVALHTVAGFRGSPADAFRLIGPRSAARLNPVVSVGESGHRTVDRLALAGLGSPRGLLRPGRNALVIDDVRISDSSGQPIGGVRGETAAGDMVEAFFRRFDRPDLGLFGRRPERAI